MTDHVPHIVIVGGGFGGLAAAKALAKAPAHVTLIDRNNHHVFQPLLYQVATSVLTPGQIGAPIREVLAKKENVTVILGEVTGVDKDRRQVFVNSVDREGVPIDYDYLVLATGVRHSYFGHDEFAQFAPGLKGLADAVAIRNKILRAFEQAEAEEDPAKHRDLLTFVLVGAGPTGVEMAGAIAVLVRDTLRSQFRRIDPTSARIILVDMAPRVLGTFLTAFPSLRRLPIAYGIVAKHPIDAAVLDAWTRPSARDAGGPHDGGSPLYEDQFDHYDCGLRDGSRQVRSRRSQGSRKHIGPRRDAARDAADSVSHGQHGKANRQAVI